MHSPSKPQAHLRFAILSFAVVALVSAGLTLVLRGLISDAHESEAVRATRAVVAAPVAQALGGGELSANDFTRRGDALAPFVGGDVLAVRAWSGDRVAASRGSAMPVIQPAGSNARLRADDGTSVFAVYSDGPGYTIEVDRVAAPIDAAIVSAQNKMITVTVLAALLGFGVTQAAFWLSVRRWAGQHRRLEYMYTRGQEIRSSLDLNDVVGQITHDGTKLAKAQYGLLVLFEQETGELMLRATYDAATGDEKQHQRVIDEWFLRRAVATQTTIISTNPMNAYVQVFGEQMDVSNQVRVLSVPMSLRDRVIGAIAVIRSASMGAYGAQEVRLVQELADQAVMAVEQALLFAKVRSYADELEMSYDTTLKVLMAALDTKDDATEGHCERVAKLTAHLARQMNVPESSLVDMERGALLHDVGKIGVPDEVLKKPKDLNEMEWEAMRKHPLLAGVMVGKVGFLEGALPILLYHHERFDGAGYPFGLAAEKIPLDARIFSVVDSYDAMTSDRPYRKAMGHEEAMAEVRANSGTQFDPIVVAAFEDLMRLKPQLQAHVPHPISRDHLDHDDFTPPIDEEQSAA